MVVKKVYIVDGLDFLGKTTYLNKICSKFDYDCLYIKPKYNLEVILSNKSDKIPVMEIFNRDLAYVKSLHTKFIKQMLFIFEELEFSYNYELLLVDRSPLSILYSLRHLICGSKDEFINRMAHSVKNSAFDLTKILIETILDYAELDFSIFVIKYSNESDLDKYVYILKKYDPVWHECQPNKIKKCVEYINNGFIELGKKLNEKYPNNIKLKEIGLYDWLDKLSEKYK